MLNKGHFKVNWPFLNYDHYPDKDMVIILVKQHQLGCILVDCQHPFQSQMSYETQLIQFVLDISGHLEGAAVADPE